jgi:site-specific DNA-methyltransferase (adenine-specific)
MTPYYDENGVTIYHGDAYDIVDSLEFTAVVSDPPYGINWKPRVNHQDQTWRDRRAADLKPFLRGQHHLFWGGNYFTDQLPASESWFIWIKRPGDLDFDNDRRSYSVLEMAWSDFGGKPRMRHHVWDGGMRQGDSSNRQFLHPAQKPLEIMRWCFAALPETDGPVLDPFMGSGTTLVAATEAGRRAIGIEREEQYCEIAVQRLAQGVLEFS